MGMDGDEDSLFGSPPPEAAPAIPRGRSPSPLLALPGVSTASPSHLPSTSAPIAGPHPQTSATCSAAPQLTNQVAVHDGPQSRPPAAASSRSRMTRKRRTTTKKTSGASSTRTPTPQIQVPGPTTQLPRNFLRNQSALLGLAGLVGRVKPSALALDRGTTRDLPIIIDSSAVPPVPPTEQTGSAGTPHPQPFTVSELPRLTDEEIVAALVDEPEIFPLLENILKLHANSSSTTRNPPPPPPPPPAPGPPVRVLPSPPSPGPRPRKRRKLKYVPAGAVDWDVPYPFAQGEGPEMYYATWEHTRGRRLVQEFVELVKKATESAAKKKLMKELGQGNLVYYRPGGRDDGPRSIDGQIQTDRCTPASSIPSCLGSPAQSSHLFDFSDISNAPPIDDTASFSNNFDQGFLDNWISMLDAFPDVRDGAYETSTAAPGDLNMNFDAVDFGLEFDGLGELGGEDFFLCAQTCRELFALDGFNASGLTADPSIQSNTPMFSHNPPPDSAIDPQLWALSMPMDVDPVLPYPILTSTTSALLQHDHNHGNTTSQQATSSNSALALDRPPTPSLSITSLASPHLSQSSFRDTPEVVTPSASVVGFGDMPSVGFGGSVAGSMRHEGELDAEECRRANSGKGKGKQRAIDLDMDVDVDFDRMVGQGIFNATDVPDGFEIPPSSTNVTQQAMPAKLNPLTSNVMLPSTTLPAPFPRANTNSQSPLPDNARCFRGGQTPPFTPGTTPTPTALPQPVTPPPTSSSSNRPPRRTRKQPNRTRSAPSTSTQTIHTSLRTSTSTPLPPLPPPVRRTAQKKQEILQQVRERLMLLKAEYERAKVEYWECGLEHACMVQMGKELRKNMKAAAGT
ncbi:hypothetical protein PLEOSDRAFT_1113962 [Pleurotus ostreatus PC15]|uniref:Uncharacterized protein n=1 Tax=Pleurotus ostreatus (strain PC15) TaxID=1137138 RepID=A0A067NL75_PLEO1|nr:hypothetical protein PLEOSDRAFT_1113962 [Pleurotus ostreatus PC15]